MAGALGAYFLIQASISLTTWIAGSSHPSFRRGVVVRFGLGIAFTGLGFISSLGPLMLLGLLAAGVIGLILSDTLGPEPPSNFEGGREQENQP